MSQVEKGGHVRIAPCSSTKESIGQVCQPVPNNAYELKLESRTLYINKARACEGAILALTHVCELE